MPLTLAMKRLFPSCRRVKAAMDASVFTATVYLLAPCLTRLPYRRKASAGPSFREKSASVSRSGKKRRARQICPSTRRGFFDATQRAHSARRMETARRPRPLPQTPGEARARAARRRHRRCTSGSAPLAHDIAAAVVPRRAKTLEVQEAMRRGLRRSSLATSHRDRDRKARDRTHEAERARRSEDTGRANTPRPTGSPRHARASLVRRRAFIRREGSDDNFELSRRVTVASSTIHC